MTGWNIVGIVAAAIVGGVFAAIDRSDGIVPAPLTRSWQHRDRAAAIDPLIGGDCSCRR